MAWQDDPLVGTRPKWESDPIIGAAPLLLDAAPAPPAIELAPGAPMPRVLQSSANPYSAGSYSLGRIFTVGDEATFRESDMLTGLETRMYIPRVTRVDEDADRVEINNGREIWDLMGNVVKTPTSVFEPPRQFVPAELQVGKKWTAAWKGTEKGQNRFIYVDFQIVRRETVAVPAGSFQAFRIEGNGANRFNGTKLQLTLWLVPGLNVGVKRDWIERNRGGFLTRTERLELVSLRQQFTGIQT